MLHFFNSNYLGLYEKTAFGNYFGPREEVTQKTHESESACFLPEFRNHFQEQFSHNNNNNFITLSDKIVQGPNLTMISEPLLCAT